MSIPIGIVDQIAGYVTEAYKSVPRRGAESGGVLLGAVHLGPITDIFITGFETVPCDYRFGPSFILPDAGKAEFRTVMGRHAAGEILGYYRSHTRSGFALEPSDREIVEQVFPGRSGLVLLIKPSATLNYAANYFFFQHGRLQMMPVGTDFRFQGSVPGGSPPALAEDPELPPPPPPAPPPRKEMPFAEYIKREPLRPFHQSAAFDPEPVEQPAPPPAVAAPSDPVKRRRKLQWEIGAAGLMILAALGLLWWQYHGTNDDEATVTTPAPAAKVASLGLSVQPGDGGWRISWDPQSPAARDSARGALDVTEDTTHERIPLTAAQIQSGFATYHPIGDDITFRLNLIAGDNSVASETYRVVAKARDEGAIGATRARTAPPSGKSDTKTGTKAEGPYIEPEVVNRVAPEVPEGIRPRITEPQPIDVRVTIDRDGRVTSAKAIQHQDGLIDYLAGRAVLAAKQWTFTPAKRGGEPVESTRTIHFVFEQ